MQTWTDPLALQAEILGRRSRGERIGFVPTMGFLHRGHTSLMDIARERCDWLVVSIYVNPLQFGPSEDLDAYPRDPDGDAQRCREHGVDAILMPSDLYAPGHSTRVNVTGLSSGLCGADRPTHFEGVTTVVARLFGLVQPHVAVFGEKDFQQLATIRRMVQDLAMPIDIIGGPLIRDAEGIALSSRNAYLSEPERQRARTISRALRAMAAASMAGEKDVQTLIAQGRAVLDVDQLDYLEVRAEADLTPLTRLDGRPARAFVAAQVGRPRLIDNLPLPCPETP